MVSVNGIKFVLLSIHECNFLYKKCNKIIFNILYMCLRMCKNVSLSYNLKAGLHFLMSNIYNSINKLLF